MTKLALKGDIIKVSASSRPGILHQITTRDAGKACARMGTWGLTFPSRSSSGYWVINGACVPQQETKLGGEEPVSMGC